MSGYLGLDTEQERLTFGGFIADIAERHGDREALVFGDRRLTYHELEREVRQFARALLAAGVTKGSSVALMLGNRPEFVIAAFGAGSIGAVVVPVSTFASTDERDYILRHSDACLLITQGSLLKHQFVDELLDSHPELAEGIPGKLRSTAFPFLRGIVSLDPAPQNTVESWDEFLARADDISEVAPQRGDGRGPPARPGHHHLHLRHERLSEGGAPHQRHPGDPELAMGGRARAHGRGQAAQPVPLLLVGGFTMTLGGPLAAGATVVIVESFDAGAALELMEREGVTALQVMPETYNEIVEHPDFRSRDLSALTLAVGAEPLIAALPDREWRAQANGYGLTETFTLCTWAEPEETGGEFRVVHGRALPGIDLRIVDSETGEPLATGELGEIAVKGVTFMLGYHKTDPSEYLDRNGYFRTGDSGYLDETGILHWGGRLTGMIKTAGANVSPEEIRSKLLQWDRLKGFGVVPVPHPLLGEAVVLCAIRDDADPVTAEEVIEHLKGVLASYKVPKRVVFVDEDELAYTASEKVKLGDAQRVAARHVAADDPDWGAHLRAAHPDLLDPPGGTSS